MRMLGEEPATKEVSAYIGELWSGNPYAASMTRECWRSVYRAKTSIGQTRRHEKPLYQPDRLIGLHDLSPSTEERLAAVAHRALAAFLQAASGPTTPAYVERKRELDAALEVVQHLRFLRFGPTEIGIRGFLDADPPRRPKGP
jgi:hypothetical protein